MLAQNDVRRLFDYDPVSGELIWKRRDGDSRAVTRFNRMFAGKAAGCTKNSRGYVNIHYKRASYQAHRLIWLHVHGELPELIDHIDRDKANNRLSNLRPATHSQNNFNCSRSRGADRGVYETPNGRWQARLFKDRKFQYLGTFDKKEDALEAFRVGAQKLFGEFANNAVADAEFHCETRAAMRSQMGVTCGVDRPGTEG